MLQWVDQTPDRNILYYTVFYISSLVEKLKKTFTDVYFRVIIMV